MRKADPLGPLMVDVAGRELVAEDLDILEHPLVGGLILFTRNYENPMQLQALVAAIRRQRSDILIAADYEGGRVQRFRQGGFTVLPPARAFGLLYNSDRNRALKLLRDCGWMIGSELRAIGADLCFAPVLDIDGGVSAVIGDRSFHADRATVAELALAMMKGLREAGMAATGKHFPGHGGVVEDSHKSLPVDHRPLEQIRREDMQPFETLIREGLPSVMMAHILFPEVDAQPASLSRKWIMDELRGRIGFTGAVFCDDLSMGGAASAGSYPDRARMALEAGCDMLPVCNNRSAVVELLDQVRHKTNSEAGARLEKLRARLGVVGLEQVQQLPEWKQASNNLATLA